MFEIDEDRCDLAQILRALQVLFGHDPEIVTEMRALEVPKYRVVSCYSTVARLGELAEHAARLSGQAKGVYILLNPALKDCWARAANKPVAFAKDTTKDNEIVRRIWLFVDFDPKRPSGISSTDSEHEAALDRAKKCRDWLRELGIDAVILADSGNGAHLLIRIDLPNDAESADLVKRFLKAVHEKWSDKEVEVDESTSNAARICRLYGTLACKGSDTEERPHRISRMLDEPKKLEPVPRELLERVAGGSPKAEQSQEDPVFNQLVRGYQRQFDLEKWITEHKVPVVGTKPWNGGTVHHLAVCPWDATHTNNCACIIQFQNGGVHARCLHNTCKGKGFPELRDVYESGWREKPDSYQPLEGIDDPDRLARLCLLEGWMHLEGWRLRHYQGQWYVWNDLIYQHLDDGELDTVLSTMIKCEFDRVSVEAQARKDERNRSARKVTRGLLSNVKLALSKMVFVSKNFGLPCWLDGEAKWPAQEMLVCRNGMAHLPSLAQGGGVIDPLTPRLFSTFALDYAIDLGAPSPEKWLGFLRELWPGDREAIQTLQEWFVYCLTQDTRQQKILMMVGPPRAGKGVITRILTALVGSANVTGPPLSRFRGDFGLQPLLDKALAIIPDARLRGQTDIVVERLLSISGEDLLTVNRKNKDPIAVKLATRIVLVTNELPRLDDASGALVNRMIILRFTRTFLGRENPNLTGQLLEELPGILLWAIAGWRSLTQRGSFVQPESANQLLCELQELSSPIMGFIHDCCHVGPHHTVERKALYEAYKAWCAESGRHSPVTRESFGRDLRAAVPGLTDTQPSSNGQRSRYYQGISLRSN